MCDDDYDYDLENSNTLSFGIALCLVGVLAGILLTLVIQQYKVINTILEIRQGSQVWYSNRMPELNHQGLYNFYDFTKDKQITIAGCFYVIEVLEVDEKNKESK